MPTLVSAISEALEDAFRAAFLLTGSADSAENAVLNGIASLESTDDIEKALLAKTVAYVLRQRAEFPNGLEDALMLLPHELQRLVLLSPVSRDCFLVRMLFGVPVAGCVAILKLTVENFEETLRDAFEQLSKGRGADLLLPSSSKMEGACQ